MAEPQENEVIQAVMTFLNTGRTWAEKKHIVKELRNILLTDEADQFLARLMLQYQDDEGAVRDLEKYRTLLDHCRNNGINNAFAPLLDPIKPPELVIRYNGASKPSWEQTIQPLHTFLNTGQTWVEKKWIVEAQRDILLTDIADQILVHLLLQYKDDKEAVDALQIYRKLLVSCRQIGIDDAFFSLLAPDVTQELIDLVLEFVGADSFKARQLIEDRQEDLLSDDAFEIFHLLLQRHRNDKKLHDRIEERLGLLKLCKRDGIEATLVEEAVSLPQDVFEAIQLFLDAQTLEEKKQIIETRKEQLLSNEADQALAFLIARARDNNDLIYLRRFQYCRQILKRCRQQGIVATFVELLTPSVPEEVIDAVKELVNTPVDKLKHIIESKQEVLLTDAADELLATSLAQYKNDKAAIVNVQMYRTLLQRCMQEGIDAAFNGYQQLLIALKVAPSLTRLEDMPRKVELCRAALRFVDRDKRPELWGSLQVTLADSLVQCPLLDRANNLEEALQHYQLALDLFSKRDVEMFFEEENQGHWASTQMHMGIAYMQRSLGNRAENIELAISCFQQVQTVYKRETSPISWARLQNNLGEAYRYRIHGMRADNMEQAILCQQSVLEVVTREADPELWANAHTNLGNAFANRIRGDRGDNLEQACYHYQRALEVYTREISPFMWGQLQHSLSHIFSGQVRGERAENREQAILYNQLALETLTYERFPLDWALVQNSLAGAFTNRIYGDRASNIEQAIQHYQLALKVHTREAYPERWAAVQVNLGENYRLLQNYEQAFEYYNSALEVYTREVFPERWAQIQKSLGRAFIDQNRNKQALQHLQLALEIYTLDQYPVNYREIHQLLGDLSFAQHDWGTANASYKEVIAVNEILYQSSYIQMSRRFEMSQTAQSYVNAAYCLLKLGYPVEAFLRLEQGKTRLLADALALSTIGLATLPLDQQKIIENEGALLRELEAEQRLSQDTPGRRSDAELGQLLRRVRIRIDRFIETHSQALQDFMPTSLNLSNILSLTPEKGAIIAPLITSQGSAVFVLPYGLETITAAHVILLDEFNRKAFSTILIGTRNKPGWLNAYIRWSNGGSYQEWMQTIEDCNHQLWITLFGPIYDKLTQLGVTTGAPVMIMPQGGLGLLPLHAAWRLVNGKKHAFIDDYTVSYVPSAYTLYISLRRTQEVSRHKQVLLSVVNPTGDLPYTLIECDTIAQFFGTSTQHILLGKEATKEAILTRAAGTSYLHLACHGFYNWHNVMESGLILADGSPFTLTEIISPQLDLSTSRLVTLSACETGLTEFSDVPDEYIGLPAGFLQAGVPGVVGGLWSVNDLSTALLMVMFYEYHLRGDAKIGGGPMPPAWAMCKAQLWLRDVTNEELTVLFDMYRKSNGSLHMAAIAEKQFAEYARRDPDERPFAHPYYWAAFAFYGV